MPKLKTHKGMKKRFKVSANGKVQHKRCGSSHLMSHKSGKRVRRLRKQSTLNVAAESRRVRSALHIRPAVNPLDVEAGRLAALAEKAETSTGPGTGDPAPTSD
ncbi:MAG: 50S ribosomal protein L35 [Isosphaeraceae bacterium]|jgi:large subunit ribosomal protein L35